MDLLRSQGDRFDRDDRHLLIEHDELVQDMQAEARGLTSGTTSTATLIRMGHPLGRRLGGRKRGSLPTLPINAQTGKLRGSWRRYKVDLSGKTYYDVIPTVPYAKYVLAVGGTTKMVARGFWREMRKRWRKRNFDLLLRMRDIGRA